MKDPVLLFKIDGHCCGKGGTGIHTFHVRHVLDNLRIIHTFYIMLSSSMYLRAYFFTEEDSQLLIIDNLALSTGRLSLEHLLLERLYLRLCLARCRLYIDHHSLETCLNSAFQFNSLSYFDGQRPDGRLLVTFFAILLAIDSPK